MPAPTPQARWRAEIHRRLGELRIELGHGQAAAPSSASEDRSTLQAELQRLSELAGHVGEVGIAVCELSTGAPVFEYHADRELNPASNHKLLTAIAAVELLGPDYRFQTEVRLEGDSLVLVGDGDPALQVDDLRALAARTAERVDLSRVRRIVVDETAFSRRHFGPGYPEADGASWSYLAPSGALSLQFNTVEVHVRATRRGQPARVWVSPPSDHIVIDNRATTDRGGHVEVRSEARDGKTAIVVSGTVSASDGVVFERRRVVDPAAFTASTFAAALAWHTGREPLPLVEGKAGPDAQPIATHESAPLSEVLSAALVFSNNFTSEQVLRTLGRRASGQPGDWTNGRAALEAFWHAIGRDEHELTFENASGYSDRGRVTADGLVALLALIGRADSRAASLMGILPASGKHGTMRHRLARARGRVRAKTGTLHGASALSGVVTSRDGSRNLGFSILVNGDRPAAVGRRLQDRVVMALVQHLDAGDLSRRSRE